MPEWLPSEAWWINELAEIVLDGKIALIRAVPRWGATSICESVAHILGESAVLVHGRSVTEKGQKDFREQLRARVSNAIETTGFAQVLFDNYGHAIRRSQGGHLHSVLYRLLVDSPTARDTGALIMARPNDMLDPGFSGSPLISRAQTVVLPILTHHDAEVLEDNLADLRALVGDSTWLARRFLGGRRAGLVSIAQQLTSDRRRIVGTLPPGAVNRLSDSDISSRLDPQSRECLMCLGSVDADDVFTPALLVVESGLIDEVHSQNPAWPSNFSESVERFSELLAGAPDAFWVDRYLFSDPSRARDFIQSVRALTSTRLNILTSKDDSRSGFSQAITRALVGVDNVDVRFMHWADRKPLHDRHLVMPALGTGYTLPTANVVLGVDTPGTAVAARIPAIDYSSYWNRASTVFPV